jgi:hypothetical protein
VGKQQRPSRSQERERFWRRLIAGQPKSGRSVLAWCGEHGVSAPSFYIWRRKLAKLAAERKLRRPQLLPVEIVPSAVDGSVAPLEIELPSRARVSVRPGCDLELLRQVLALLQPDRREEAEGC